MTVSTYRATIRCRRKYRRCATGSRCYSAELVELDFSQLGICQSASAKESMNTPETFCGSLAYTDPQKVSDLQGHRNASSAQEEAQKTPCSKGTALKSGIESTAWPVSEPWELPCQERSSRAQAPRTPLARPSDEHAHPFRSEMAKVALEKLFGKWPEVSRACFFGARKRPTWAASPPLVRLRNPDSAPNPIFQTV